jgi:hypothetical protein
MQEWILDYGNKSRAWSEVHAYSSTISNSDKLGLTPDIRRYYYQRSNDYTREAFGR